ncbi:uncharacterized protein LOC111700146 isoform X2 [Eurytemora carolleeae]|uniref:uncharacterized protein LOC111700146 isoform X2 n=1 Tax=Eurytemora carolleeae TaxID=1294199 RepID=UPI000C778399|nr:uncharacterized protein LOC111700146 isoform X2 [Eurytemora carolleeae]|eukprot:XP_023326735.1 uncharacterized protein LOC111700146 isoform X2 [Eurytemora affinis]
MEDNNELYPDTNEDEEVELKNKLQVPAVRHLSWRESLTVPLDVLLPSPTSPTGPSGPLDEEIRTSWNRQGTSVYTACIQCPCTSRPSNNSKRRRRNMSEDSQNSNKSLRVQFDTNSEERREDRRNERRGADEVDGQGRSSDRQKRSSEGFDREARISERYDRKVGESDRRIIQQDYRELQVAELSEKMDKGSETWCFSCKKAVHDEPDGIMSKSKSSNLELTQDKLLRREGLQVEERSGKRGNSRKSSFTAPIIDAFIRLIFLKILFVDIGISLGDVVMDFIQAINLILEGPSSVSFPYGICLLVTCWIPSISVPLHLGLGTYKDIFKTRGTFEALVLILLYICLFPLIPTLCYILLLITPRSSWEQRRRYREVERKAHEIKSITASIEAPLQLIIILYLMLRGILTLPWNESTSSSCIEDNLGRVACLPSIPMLAITFSILSIIKSMFDLNIHPLLANQECGLGFLNSSLQLFLCYLPFSLSNIIFRIFAYSFILVYLDYWSCIPFTILLLCNLVTFGFSFTRLYRSTSGSRPSGTPEREIRLAYFTSGFNTVDNQQHEEIGWNQTILNAVPGEEIGWDRTILAPQNLKSFNTADLVKNSDSRKDKDGSPSPKSLKMQGSEISKNIFVFSEPGSPCIEGPDEKDGIRPDGPLQLFNRYISQISYARSENSSLPRAINETNTSIFFNSLSGLFFPSCHSHIKPFCSTLQPLPAIDPEINIKSLLSWQNRVLGRQVLLYNSVLLLVLVLVWILVTFTEFNYNSNVLDPFWFSIVFSILVCMWLLTVLLSYELKHPLKDTLWSLFSPLCSDSEENSEKNRNDVAERAGFGISSSLTGRVGIFFILSALLALPPLIALVGFKLNNSTQPYIFLLQDDSTQVDLGILAAFPVHDTGRRQFIVGRVETSCSIDENSDFTGRILVVNSSSPLCRILLSRTHFYNITQSTGSSGIVILDSTPVNRWRVSSPYNINSSKYQQTYGVENIPVLMVREPDWRKYDAFLQNKNNKISIVYEESVPDFKKLFSCSRRKDLNLGGEYSFGVEGPCSGGKYLSNNGSILENICVKGECTQYGRRCISSFFSKFEDLTLTLECRAEDMRGLDLLFKLQGQTIDTTSILTLTKPQGLDENYCCRSSEYNSTFLQVYQEQSCFTSWREVDLRAVQGCQWTDWMKTKCTAAGVNVVRYCLVEYSCVIKEYYSTRGCTSDEQIQHCQTNQNKC